MHPILGIVQYRAIANDVTANIEAHLKIIELAAQHHINYLQFPELSLTGYSPSKANRLQLLLEDERLASLQSASNTYGITVSCGAALSIKNDLPAIASLVFKPNSAVEHYSKQNLHAGEQRYFSRGSTPYTLQLGEQKIGLGICADNHNPDHLLQLSKLGSTIYASSVLVSDNGYQCETDLLKGYAEQYKMLVLMANLVGQNEGFYGVGGSSVWQSNGQCIGCLNKEKSGLLIIKPSPEGIWQSTSLYIEKEHANEQ